MLLTFLTPFRTADQYLADRLYQKGSVSSGRIVVIEIDEKALETYGSNPLDWDRTVYADVLNWLNASDESRPAVIGLDVIFAHDEDLESDRALAEAAAAGNVVTAGMYYYGNQLVTKPDGSYEWTKGAVVDEAMPYPALGAVTQTGIVNVNLDEDGVVRHAVLTYRGSGIGSAGNDTDETGSSIDGTGDEPGAAGTPSFALLLAQAYAEANGLTLTLPKGPGCYLEFTYPAGGYLETISLADVCSGQYPASYFHNKIVLIGACAASMQDEYLTPVSRTQAMYGVEVHANIIDMILRGSYKKELSDGMQRLLLAAVLAVCAFVFAGGRFRTMLAGWLGIVIGWPALCLVAYRGETVLHPLWILAGATVLFIAGVAGHYLTEAASRRQLRQQFERYVDPAVLRQILDQGADGLQLEGRECTIAVLFVDICGFTSLSERLAPAEVVGVLNQYLEMVTDCIMRNGGTLDKFIGDCAMAFWNAPFEQDGPVRKAVQAGQDMIAGAAALNKDLGFDLGFAVGVHCGRAVVGNIGSSKRMDFTAIGDTVNTASRLESLKISGLPREGRIYVSQEVIDALRRETPEAFAPQSGVPAAGGARTVTVEDLGAHALKGKEQPVRVYAVQ